MSAAASRPENARTPRSSQAVVADLMMPHQANGLKRPSVFGGVIMSMVDRCAALSAMRHSGGQCTTLSIDRILFKEPIRVGELVEVRSRGVHVGRPSLSVLADVYAEDIATGCVATRTNAGSPSCTSTTKGGRRR